MEILAENLTKKAGDQKIGGVNMHSPTVCVFVCVCVDKFSLPLKTQHGILLLLFPTKKLIQPCLLCLCHIC